MISAEEARARCLLSDDNNLKNIFDYLDRMITKLSKEGKTCCVAHFKITNAEVFWRKGYVFKVVDELEDLGYKVSLCICSSSNMVYMTIRWCDATVRVSA